MLHLLVQLQCLAFFAVLVMNCEETKRTHTIYIYMYIIYMNTTTTMTGIANT